MDPQKIRALLESVRGGGVAVEEALAQLRDLPFTDLGYAMVDHHRALRQGAPEVIFGERKTAAQIVGIAGIHRLLMKREVLSTAGALIVVAGMEGALPSVVGGMTDRPVIGVPTSVGYGAAFGGLTALAAMLTSCASGVTVVNIDNGFGAAFAAARMDRG